MKKFTALIHIILLIQFVLPNTAYAGSKKISSYSQQLSAGDVISAINGYRQANGLASLSPNSLLSSLAQGQSDYQASIGTVTHTGPGGTTPQERASAAGYGGGNFFYLSEIIYGGYQQTVQNALSWWQNSSLHNSIMLSSNYSEIGAGVAASGDQVYFTAVLGGPTGSSTSSGGGNDDGSGSGENTQPTQSGPVIMPVQKVTPQADGAIIHTVLTGQTLWTIAAIYEVELSQLYELNDLNQYSFVFPGDQIIIRPAGEYGEDKVPEEALESPQPEKTLNAKPQKSTQMLGSAFSSENTNQSQALVTQTPTPFAPDPTPVPTQQKLGLFEEDPTARNLIIGAFIILILVLVGSVFIQNPSNRPPKEDQK